LHPAKGFTALLSFGKSSIRWMEERNVMTNC
jgi:hypothetical protein